MPAQEGPLCGTDSHSGGMTGCASCSTARPPARAALRVPSAPHVHAGSRLGASTSRMSKRLASRSVARCAMHSPAPRQVDGLGDGVRELDARNGHALAGPGAPGEAEGPQLGRHLRRRFYVGLRVAPAVLEDDRTSGWSKSAHASTVIACHKRSSGRRRLSTPRQRPGARTRRTSNQKP